MNQMLANIADDGTGDKKTAGTRARDVAGESLNIHIAECFESVRHERRVQDVAANLCQEA